MAVGNAVGVKVPAAGVEAVTTATAASATTASRTNTCMRTPGEAHPARAP